MGDRKFIGLWVAMFVAVVLVVAGSEAWASEGKVERTRDTFQLGDSPCEAVITYKNDQILNAFTRSISNPTDTTNACYRDVTRLVKPIQHFVVCNAGDLTNCQVLAGVEQTVMEWNTGSCIYPINTRTGQRLAIPYPGTTCP
jgi:hypothetical protein